MCLDNYFTSTRAGIWPARQSHLSHVHSIQDLMGHPRFEFIRHDVTEPFFCECDMIYNMACPASPVHYQWNPIKTTKAGSGTARVCVRGLSTTRKDIGGLFMKPVRGFGF
eukprot:Skav202279  [mRNA]  locus=scaffold3044:220304:221559:- [translate_table: standard]